MSFYVLELASSTWLNDNQVLDVMPYRITWENRESGQKICETIVKVVIESFDSSADIPNEKQENKLGFRFYKYDNSFDFATTPSKNRPKMVSDAYIPSKTMKGVDISKTIEFALAELESPQNQLPAI